MLAIHADSISLPFNLEDDRIVDTENVFPLNSFSTRLPAVMDWSVAYSPQPDVTLTAEWEQGLTAQMSGTRRACVMIGGEYRGIPVLPLRAGFYRWRKNGIIAGHWRRYRSRQLVSGYCLSQPPKTHSGGF
ncbi:MAG: hypothetical protein R3C26_02460 [Calditrichia bacterium]